MEKNEMLFSTNLNPELEDPNPVFFEPVACSGEAHLGFGASFEVAPQQSVQVEIDDLPSTATLPFVTYKLAFEKSKVFTYCSTTPGTPTSRFSISFRLRTHKLGRLILGALGQDDSRSGRNRKKSN